MPAEQPTMSDSDRPQGQPGDERGRRLRVDPEKVDAARRFLGRLDQTVFSSGGKHADDAHNGLVARIVSALFARG
jgi:hypothetical protein